MARKTTLESQLKKCTIYNFILKLYKKKYPKTKFGIVSIDDAPYMIVYVWNNEWIDVVTPMEEAEPIAKEIADEYALSYRNYADGRLKFCGYILNCNNVDITEALLKIKSN